jgi:hypothetical protein
MSHVKRIAAASLVSAAVLAPAAGAAFAVARPAQGPPPATSSTDIPWNTVGLAAFAGAAVGAGVVIVVRHVSRVPEQA